MMLWDEAAPMPFGHYKRVWWGRMKAWWVDYGGRHPERAAFVQAKIEGCDRQLELHRLT